MGPHHNGLLSPLMTNSLCLCQLQNKMLSKHFALGTVLDRTGPIIYSESVYLVVKAYMVHGVCV